MLCKSEALVLRKTGYAENSAIVSMFTQEHGVLSFLMHQIHGKSSKAAFLQPGNLLEIVYYYQNTKNLQRLKEIKQISGPDSTIPLIQQMVLFCTEITGKTISEAQHEPAVFDCIKQALQSMHSETSMWFIPSFLLNLATVCGHGIDTTVTNTSLDLNTGEWHGNYAGKQILSANEIEMCNILQSGKIPQSDGESRRLLTTKLLIWFDAHLLHGRKIKSYEILRELYDH